MKKLKDFKVSFKILLLSTILAFIFLGGSVGLIIFEARNAFREFVVERAEKEVEVSSNRMGAFFEQVKDDVFSLSDSSPMYGFLRTRDMKDSREEFGDLTNEQWRDELVNLFLAKVQSRKIYYQIRYIDELGNEVVRVNYQSGQAEVVNKDKLQNKSDRSYFIEAMRMSKGEIYFSNFELNREGIPPAIEIPYVPVIRCATPIFDDGGNRKGIMVINVFADAILNEMRTLNTQNISVMLIDQDGNYLLNKNDNKQWGGKNDLNTGENFKKDFPEIESIFSMQDGNIATNGEIIFFKRVYFKKYDSRSFLVFMKDISIDSVFHSVNEFVVRMLSLSLAFFLAMFLVFYLFVKISFRPLGELLQSVRAISRGDFEHKVSISSRDEFGILAETFNEMTDKLKDLYVDMDNKIKERTNELEDERNSLKAIKERLTLATSSAGIGIWDWDVKKNILIWDDVMYKLYGIKKEDFSGAYEAWKKGVHPDDVKKSDSEVRLALKGEKNFNTIFRVVWSDGTVHFLEAKAIVSRDKEGNPVKMIGVNWDVTTEKEVDQAKTEFVSLASHQLRTPLASMGWNAEMLLAGDAGELNEEQKEFVEEIYKSNKVMNDLVNALLNTSRIDMGTFAIEPKVMDLCQVCHDVISEVIPQINEKKQNLDIQCDKSIKMEADPNLIRIVFQNLISNASKYTPQNGKIGVSVHKKDQDVLIEIFDSGYGIPKKQQSKIFKKLFRADNILKLGTEGTGLGLYIVKAIIDESGGKIWFESEENKGTTFYVTIPLKGMKKREGAKGLILS